MPFITRLPALTGADPYPDALLALDFVGARRGPQYYKALGVTTADVSKIPGWTYTGGTPAGVGSYAARQDGSLQFFPSYTNLQLYSEQFDNAQWSKGATTVTANAISAPDGTTTADKVSETAVVNSHYAASASITVTAAAQYTHSFYLKAGERSYAAIYDGVKGQGKFFNLSNGTVLGNLVAAPDSATITDAGGGWWRASITVTPAGTTTTPAVYVSSDGTSFNYLGTAGSGIYVYGGMTNLGSTASTYIPTTTAAVTVGTPRITDAGYWAEEARTNLLTYSNDYSNAAWAKVNASVSADAIAAPDGTTTADLLIENATGNVTHSASQQITKAASALAYTRSVYAKPNGRRLAMVLEDASAVNGIYAVFDLAGGQVGVAATAYGTGYSGTASIVSVGNGWYRCILSITTSTATTLVSSSRPDSGTGTAALSQQYVGNGTSGVYLWGDQTELGAFATSPIPTTSVAVTRSADAGYVSGLVVPSAFTFFIHPVPNTVMAGSFAYSVALSDGTNNNRFELYASTANAVGRVDAGGANQFNGSVASVLSTGVSARDAISVNGTTLLRAMNGVDRTGATLGTSPASSVTQMQIKSSASSVAIRRIVIYPRSFGNSELQAVTTAGAY